MSARGRPTIRSSSIKLQQGCLQHHSSKGSHLAQQGAVADVSQQAERLGLHRKAGLGFFRLGPEIRIVQRRGCHHIHAALKCGFQSGLQAGQPRQTQPESTPGENSTSRSTSLRSGSNSGVIAEPNTSRRRTSNSRHTRSISGSRRTSSALMGDVAVLPGGSHSGPQMASRRFSRSVSGRQT